MSRVNLLNVFTYFNAAIIRVYTLLLLLILIFFFENKTTDFEKYTYKGKGGFYWFLSSRLWLRLIVSLMQSPSGRIFHLYLHIFLVKLDNNLTFLFIIFLIFGRIFGQPTERQQPYNTYKDYILHTLYIGIFKIPILVYE